MKSIVIIEDHRIVIEGLKSCLLAKNVNNYLLNAFQHSNEAIEHINFYKPDLVITDLDMPKTNGFEVCKKAKERWKDCKVLAFTSYETDEIVELCHKSNFNGFVTKRAGLDELAYAIEVLLNGHDYFNDSLSKKFLNNNKKDVFQKNAFNVIALSDREREIVTLICKGHSNNAIAQKLFIAENTVKTHRRNIIKKTGVNNSAELVSFAYKYGIAEM